MRIFGFNFCFLFSSGNDNNDSNNHFNDEEVLFPNSTENGKPNSSVNNKENAQPVIETTIKKPRGSLLDVSFPSLLFFVKAF